MNKKILLPVVVGVTTFMITACAAIQSTAIDSRWVDYKKWNKITEGRVITGDHTEFLGDTHRAPDGYRDVYVNDIGLKAIRGTAPYKYPVGTVIVKEQFKNKDAWAAQKNVEHTIMVKVADSDEPNEDNWAWAAGLTGKAKANTFCSGCHSVEEDNDYVITNEDFFKSIK